VHATEAGVPADLPVGLLLAALGRSATKVITEDLRQTGIKPRHVAALTALRGGALTQQALGEAVHTDAAQLVGLLNELEAAELVSRRRDPNDRRRHIVEVSALGAARLADAENCVAQTEERLLAGLDTADRANLYRLLAQIVTNTGSTLSCREVDTEETC
jgi:DNA-binding MarR family transcriptional regulator